LFAHLFIVREDRVLDFVHDEVCHDTLRIVDHRLDVRCVPARQALECIVVPGVRCVEIVAVQIHRRECNCGLDVALEVVRVVHEVEGVARVIAQ
jgi:hypothetical protein